MHRDEERGQYPAILTEQAWSIKDLLYGQKVRQKNFTFAGPTREKKKKKKPREIQSGQDRPILPARVANQNTGFASSCPLAEPAI